MNTLFILMIAFFFLALTLASWAVEKTKWLYLVIFFALPIAAFGYWLDTPGIAWSEGWVSNSTWGPKLWIPFSLIALGMSLLALQYLVQIIDGRLAPMLAGRRHGRA